MPERLVPPPAFEVVSGCMAADQWADAPPDWTTLVVTEPATTMSATRTTRTTMDNTSAMVASERLIASCVRLAPPVFARAGLA
jgi:hypothetical protein